MSFSFGVETIGPLTVVAYIEKVVLCLTENDFFMGVNGWCQGNEIGRDDQALNVKKKFIRKFQMVTTPMAKSFDT